MSEASQDSNSGRSNLPGSTPPSEQQIPLTYHSTRPWKPMIIALSISGSLIFLGCVGGATYLIWNLSLYLELSPMQAAAGEFLNGLATGRTDAAYELTSENFRQGQSRDQFDEFLKHYPAFRKAKTHSISGALVTRVSGTIQGQIRGRVLAEPTDLDFAMILIREDGQWKVNALLVP